MRRTFMRWLALPLVMMLAFSSQAAAFSDLPETDEAREKIIRLQEQGIINGVNGAFFGDKELTYAEGIHMIVKGLDLSLDAHQVEKAPKAGFEPHTEVVYHLWSFQSKSNLVLKVILPRWQNDEPGQLPEVPSVAGVWSTANWHEREVYDMFGITFVAAAIYVHP